MILDLHKLIAKYKLDIKGVIHVGGHTGEEYETYTNLGISDNVFYEPQTLPFNIFKSTYPQANVRKKALGSTKGVVQMYTETSNKGASSSILKPALHATQYPHIKFDGSEEVELTTLDAEEFDSTKFNFLNIDVQGYELEVLKGATNTLKHIDYIICEINRAELYSSCAMVEEIDTYLSKYGFTRVETEWSGDTWGDGFYIKTNIKKQCLINQPLGLGDILFTQKIAKKAIEKGYEVTWPVHPEFMWLSEYIKGINFCNVDTNFKHKHMFKYLQTINDDNFMYLPLWHVSPPSDSYSTMKAKYDSVGLKYENWIDFLIFERNKKKEDDLFYNVLGLKDNSVYSLISNTYGSPCTNTVTVNLTVSEEIDNIYIKYIPGYTLFDWCKVIERATELHFISSSISYIIEKLHLRARLFNHYTRPNVRVGDRWPGLDFLKQPCNKLSL